MSKEKGLPPKGTGQPPMIYNPFAEVPEKEGERAVRYHRIEDDIKDLSGRILTIIDASFVNEAQNKAVKDLIKNQIREFLFRYQSFCTPNEGHSIKLD